jgi:transposase-like protein
MAASNGKYPPTEVQPGATQRRFTAAYKRQMVEEAAQCAYGEVGALLRREGLYYSYLAKWRGEREAGTLADRPRGPRPDSERAQLDRLALVRLGDNHWLARYGRSDGRLRLYNLADGFQPRTNPLAIPGRSYPLHRQRSLYQAVQPPTVWLRLTL